MNDTRHTLILAALKQNTVVLHDGTHVRVLGQGTWRMGEDESKHDAEIEALRTGLDCGMHLIDTAEMYGEGLAEELVGEAIKERREDVFLVSKVYPHNAGGDKLIAACDASLKRLGTDYLDLYLLHWRGSVPLAETVEGLEQLKENGIPVMAYSPLAEGSDVRDKLFNDATVKRISEEYGVTPAQLLLAWNVRSGDVIAIPKAGQAAHVEENGESILIHLTDEDLAALDAAFPPPSSKEPLDVI